MNGTRRAKIALVSLAALLSAAAWGVAADQKATESQVPKTKHILGLGDIKRNAKGTLELVESSVQFQTQDRKFTVPVSSISDVYTEHDSVEAVGGVLGTLAGFAPYESGRALALISKGVDILTIEYRDSDGGFHGATLMLPKGRADAFKQLLVSKGAHTSMPTAAPGGKK